MPYCPICEKCLCSTGRKGTNINRRNTLASNLRRHKALTLSGRDQKEKDSTKFGGGIISTKCGHLFHQNCLNDYITNFRTKGDCYGTTYNVLCPLCGANLSNGKTLKIDIEAHFGILEEFFQDLCKLKYMNKELKRTLELEWSDIAELEKKIEKAKAEYDNIKSLKRSNEQRCIAQEERIAKAIEDASTCYRYREIEKQLLDENINLEAVARRMEVIINSKLKTKHATPSSSTTQTEMSNESGIDQEQEPPAIYEQCECGLGHYGDLINAAINTARQSSESAGEDESIMSHRVKANVDISVQISVHSEWSMNSERSAASETLLAKRSSREEMVELCSSSSLSTDCLAIGKIISRSLKIRAGKIDEEPKIQQTQASSMSHELSARKVDEWVMATKEIQSTEKTLVRRSFQYDEHQKKLNAVQASLSPVVDKSKSYTVRSYPQPQSNLPAICSAENSGREIDSSRRTEVVKSKRLDKGKGENSHADKSRSYTIQIYNPNANLLSTPNDHSLESDHLLQALLSQGEEKPETGVVVKHKPPKPITCRSTRREFANHASAASVDVSLQLMTCNSERTYDEEESCPNRFDWNCEDEPEDNTLSIKGGASSEMFTFKAQSKQELKLQVTARRRSDRLSPPSGKISDRRNPQMLKKHVITPPNMFGHNESEKKSHQDHLQLPPICLPPPPMETDVKNDACTPRLKSLNKFLQENASHSAYEVTEKEDSVSTEVNPPTKNLSRFDELVMPPPPPSHSDLPAHLSWVVPPPPPMTARGPEIRLQNCFRTPESTRRLIESLLTSETNPSPRISSRTTENNKNPMPNLNPLLSPSKQAENNRTKQRGDFYEEDDSNDVPSESLPPPPKMFDEDSDDDQLLKAVLNQAATAMVTVPVLNGGQAETGAAGDIPAEQKEAPPIEVEVAEDSSQGQPAAPPSVPTLAPEHYCLAAERFANHSSFQDSLQSSLQSVKVGAEPAEGNAHFNTFHKRPGVVETTEYFYNPNQTRCVTPRSCNNNGLYRRSDYRLDNYSNYWAFENSVCTPIVIEQGPEYYTNRGDFITPEASYTVLQGIDTRSHDRWLADGNVSLPGLHENQESRHVKFYPRFSPGQNYP